MGSLRLILSLILISICSCSHMMNSGHYIQLKKGDSYSKLSKELKVPEWKLKSANGSKGLRAGEWVLIPLKRGFVGSNESYYNTSAYLSSGEFLWPVPAAKKISSSFGHRWGKSHEGIDIAARRGTHIVAANDGVVVYSGNRMGGYGNITVIAHKGGFFTIYAHAKKNFTKKGQKVHRGQVIAQVGSTGRSTGPHLHFEIRHNSKALNPSRFIAFKGR